MAEYLAHSGKEDYPPQSYYDHIAGVCNLTKKFSSEITKYAALDSSALKGNLILSAFYHDIGKLDNKNQFILHDRSGTKYHRPLPVNHVDAGCAALLDRKAYDAAIVVYAHHKGLPNMNEQECRPKNAYLRDAYPATREAVDKELEDLLRQHENLVREDPCFSNQKYIGDKSVYFRLMLSCLADADHTDTAEAYGHQSDWNDLPLLQAQERLDHLNCYVNGLSKDGERGQLRQKMYETCRDAKIENANIVTCDSPVGSGKTLAVMAHLLKQAVERKSRRIFVVLPYVNIIKQSVDIYRQALVLPGEAPEKVVAELHSRADFQECETRYLTSLWRAPIIVTTAVTFFETLAANGPSGLRRYHELPGSLIFIDEAHNALPIKLLPLAWHWISVLAYEWGCYWVLASGSLVRFWELKSLRGISMDRPEITDLVEPDLREQLITYEKHRISYQWREENLTREELIRWVNRTPGPRLLILNTVQNAATIANDIKNLYGQNSVEHLSTALTPEDRDKTIRRIRERLNDPQDENWTLVATSCVEAGVDFSFRTGFRELSSLVSLVQAAGRVNRHGELKDAKMWSFRLKNDSALTNNPIMEDSRYVLKTYFSNEKIITPELCTQSMNDEIYRNDSSLHVIQNLLDLEQAMEFKDVSKEFKVIDSENTCLAVIDESFIEQIRKGKGNWQMLQRKSFSVPRKKCEINKMEEIANGIYKPELFSEL